MFPYLHIDNSTLSGRNSTFIKVSADSQESWINNIFHNSRYGIFCLADGKLELISKGLKVDPVSESNSLVKIAKR